ncbi:MAG TPA: hypothetical protein VD884_09670 [Ohtaekwangia sp.]|nr:hypothetical protein [Ohtaekwangia sp.]
MLSFISVGRTENFIDKFQITYAYLMGRFEIPMMKGGVFQREIQNYRHGLSFGSIASLGVKSVTIGLYEEESQGDHRLF